MSSDGFKTIPCMSQRFVACDRAQSFLMPPDVRDWLPENHLASFVIDAVGEMDLDVSMRPIGRTAAAGRRMTRRMMVALLLYGGAGINRHGEGDERALHRRSSDPRWPRVMRRRREGVGEALTGVRVGWAIEPRNEG